MTAQLDTIVQASAPVVLPIGKLAPPAPPSASLLRAREQRALDHAAALQRWKEIAEAGGTDAWVRTQLQAKGLTESRDAEELSEGQRADFKARKKAEADERRALKRQAWTAYRAAHVTHLGVGIFWQEGHDPDKFDIEHREERARANDLPALRGADDLAKALGMTIARLRWLSFHRDVDAGTHYRRWSIPKRDGGARTITSPKRDLKAAQRWVLRQVADKLPVHGAAHGFLAARSIVTNASAHAGADTIVKLDIKDFFPTVTWRRVKGLLRKSGLAESVATLLALVATEAPRELVQFRGRTLYVATGPRALPQGAPTSPALSNALCLRMDRRLAGLARALGWVYTRYADDLTFSWRPSASDRKAGGRAPVGALLKGAGTILRGEGFAMHPSKTRVMRQGTRQRITGLVVNRAAPSAAPARVPRETLRRLRAAIHQREQGKPGKEGETLAQLRGMAAFVHMTDATRGRALLERIAKLEAQRTKDA